MATLGGGKIKKKVLWIDKETGKQHGYMFSTRTDDKGRRFAKGKRF